MRLPAAPVRGDTYYLKDGSYGSYSPTTATSGTTRIVIKKAQSYDYGRSADGCANDISAGWNAPTMGAAQAVFTSIYTGGGQGYYTIDGNGTSPKPGCGVSPVVSAPASDCGIKVAQPGPQGSTYGVIWLNGNYDNGATRASGWTIKYVELVGAGSAGNTTSNSNEHTFYCRNGCNSLLFEHNYLHDSSCDFIDTPYGDTVTFNLNHFARNYSSSNCHGQFWLADGNQNNNYTFSNNVIQDVQGTAYWSVLNGGQATNFNIYNNVILESSSLPGVSNGIFVTINSGSYTNNINIIGNTFINGHTDYSGRYSLYCDSNNCTGSITFRNNLLYNIVDDQDGTRPVGAANYPNLVRDHNSFINVPGTVGLAGSTGDIVVSSGAANPFVNLSAYNFQLTGDSSNVDNGVALAAPFNLDMAGKARGSDGVWERGAFEFAAGSLSSLSAPQNLRVTP